ncbi:N-methylhydantoinase A/oxoprolinase/acetone carboxylase beta subunit [Desulfobotulus alkaliphilus]|uniref:N-methylhydantoinase A/oxoprolinase/acetone carboxylase beta subunit n=1 Tax=Desulfobotulus alkaliphilus TaxID=622671 RepID=A0A562S8N7_9BACT|nr:hydantoinase/oxoprolinase family protein [Desulfobotulus alkaliphilus]TWI76820.1 N-methylhydantoinase A/oxoprolinase/acetone carboxylase beta subunit [Desulfobotulus alkaliphilus]
MDRYGIGMDTGGTFTDAALMDLDTGKVLATAKTPTTHQDLQLCLDRALQLLGQNKNFDAKKVSLVAVSSTLATNSIVEGQGADVGLFVIGLDKHLELPVAGIRQVTGGHTVTGEEETPLDVEGLLEGVLFFRGNVDAYAVISAMSFANPTHEKVAAKAIQLVDPKPVFCSHEVSARPGFDARAATTVLNARLMPKMQAFLEGVSLTLAKHGLEKGLRVVCGDGRCMDAEEAVHQAASTVASGPAATAWFGAGFSEKGQALVVDVGGTTTDITRIRNGSPLVNTEGSRIGNWDTHVPAVSMYTAGAGGDSFVRTGRKGMLTGPERVVPLCMAVEIPPPSEWMDGKDNASCLRAVAGNRESNAIYQLLLSHGPMGRGKLSDLAGLPDMVLKDRMAAALQKGHIESVGFTPTDALHVLGLLDFGLKEASLEGARILARVLDMKVEDFCREVLSRVAADIEDAIIDFLVRLETGKSFSAFWPDRRKHEILEAGFRLKGPLVGIGAAASFLLPEVARSLGTELILPEHHGVGNAIGALRIALAAGEMRSNHTA